MYLLGMSIYILLQKHFIFGKYTLQSEEENSTAFLQYEDTWTDRESTVKINDGDLLCVL